MRRKKRAELPRPFFYGHDIHHEIYFNKRRRSFYKRRFGYLYKISIEHADFTRKPRTKFEYEIREINVSMLAMCQQVMELIKKAEEYDKQIYLTYCRFFLLRKGHKYVYQMKFYKPKLDKKKRETFLYFPNGIPKNSKKKCYLIRESFDTSGYRIIDLGTFKQKLYSFIEWDIYLKRNNSQTKLTLKLISQEKQTYWGEIKEI